jgi:hypothetical protein
MQVAP